MSIDSSSRSGAPSRRISGTRVRVIEEPVLISHSNASAIQSPDGHEHGSLTVTPVLVGDQIATLEIRCGCGQSLAVECVYADDATPSTEPAQ